MLDSGALVEGEKRPLYLLDYHYLFLVKNRYKGIQLKN